MKRTVIAPAFIIACLAISGCVVRSVYQWLPEEYRATDISLTGTWHDAQAKSTVFFRQEGETKYYDVLFVQEENKQSRFTAALYRMDNTLFLMVGPEDRKDAGIFAILPGYLLFKAELNGNTMKLYGMDLDSFGNRIQKQKIQSMENGNKDDGYVLLSNTSNMTAFVKSQIKDASFFKQEPLYNFQKMASK